MNQRAAVKGEKARHQQAANNGDLSSLVATVPIDWQGLRMHPGRTHVPRKLLQDLVAGHGQPL